MEDQGIMALPQAGMQAPTVNPAGDAAIAAFEQMRQQVDPMEFSTELLNTAEQADPATVQEFKRSLAGLQLPPEVLNALGQMIDIILSDPQNYQQIRKELIASGVPENILPPEFDAAYFGAMNLAIDQISAQSIGTQQPQQFANGGLAMSPVAAGIASLGRGPDTMLAHITPSEARLLRSYGGRGTINPATGIREFGWFSSAIRSIGNAVSGVFSSVTKAVSSVISSVTSAVKKFVSSDIGRIVTTAALAFFVGPAAASMLGVTSAAGVAAVSGFIGSTGSSLLAGQSVKNALKNGAVGALTAGATAGLMGGAGAFESGSYTGPTTVSGQVERFTEGLQSLGGPAGAPTEVTGRLDYTGTGDVIPGAGRPVMPTGTGMEAFDASNVAPPVTSPTAGIPQAITPPEFVATAPGAGVDVAGTAQGIGSIPGTPEVSPNIIDEYNVTGGAGTQIPPPSGPGLLDKTLQAGKEFFSPSPDIAAQQARAANYGLQTTDSTAPGYAFHKDVSPAIQKDIISAGQPLFGTTSRLVGTGLGALALTGGFTPKQEPPPGIVPRTTGFDLYAQNPTQYNVVPGGAATVYAPPNITPGYGTSTYIGSPSGYGQMGQAIGRPSFQVRDPRDYLFGGYSPTGIASLNPSGLAAYSPARYRTGGFAMGGGLRSLAQRYPRRNGAISGPGTETSDEIPAMLSDGEFVMTARAVRGAGGGSRRDGAKRMYQMMRKFERNA